MFFFFKQKTADEMRISDWSSDVCSSDLPIGADHMGVDLLPGIQRRIGSTRIRVPESRIHEAVAVWPPADRLKANSRDRSIDELARLKVEHMQRVVLDRKSVV